MAAGIETGKLHAQELAAMELAASALHLSAATLPDRSEVRPWLESWAGVMADAADERARRGSPLRLVKEGQS